MKFWDSSALIALCVQEPRTPRVRKIAADDPAIVAWWGTLTECQSAFARLRRDGVLSRAHEHQAREVAGRLAREWTEIEPTAEVRDTAGRVLLLHPLRALDALQLAAALVWGQGRGLGRPFVCFDDRLRSAAQAEGFQVLPV